MRTKMLAALGIPVLALMLALSTVAPSIGTSHSAIVNSVLQDSVTYSGTVTTKPSYVFTATGSLSQSYVFHTATLLPDGQVLIVGGNKEKYRPTTTVEIFDPTTGSFMLAGNLSNKPLFQHTATLLPDGRVLIAGGDDGTRKGETAARIFDPTTGWFTWYGHIRQSRFGHSATLLPDGRVLIAGGYISEAINSSTTAEVFDPTTGLFAPTKNLNQRRTYHTATLLFNGRVLIVGGDDGIGNSTTTSEIFDPSAGVFVSTGNLNQPRVSHTATLLPDGRVLIAGGKAPAGLTAEIFDPTTGLFAPTKNLNQRRIYHTATLLPDGRVLIAGGTISSSTTSEVFDPILGSFTITGDLKQWRRSQTTTLLLDGRVLITGGKAGSDKPSYNTAEIGTPQPRNTFSATLTTPVNWEFVRGSMVVTITGATTGSTIHSGSVSSDARSWGDWIDMQPGIPVTTTFVPRVSMTGDKSIYLRLRDETLLPDQQPIVVRVTVSDTEAPVGGSVSINSGALATSDPSVYLTWSLAKDRFGVIKNMRFSTDGISWSSWGEDYTMIYDTLVPWTLPPGDGTKVIYSQFRDSANNVSNVVSDTIRLDTAAGTDRLMTINRGAIWTNTTGVTLTVGAPAYTTQVQVSNDGGFANAVWQPFDTHVPWQIVPFGSYAIPRTVYVRTRGPTPADTSAPYSDDIIFDPVPPVGSVAIASVDARQVKVTLNASDPDNLSGIGGMRVGLKETFAQADWEPFVTTKSLPVINPASIVVYAQFRDGAGNVTEVLSAQKLGSVTQYLPLGAK